MLFRLFDINLAFRPIALAYVVGGTVSVWISRSRVRALHAIRTLLLVYFSVVRLNLCIDLVI